jgi:hypothetical protein
MSTMSPCFSRSDDVDGKQHVCSVGGTISDDKGMTGLIDVLSRISLTHRNGIRPIGLK